MDRWRQAADWRAAVILWVAAFASGLIGSQIGDDISRGLYCAAAAVGIVALADRHLGWRVRVLECQVRKLQARDEGEKLVLQFARGEQPKVTHPAGNGNGHGPA
jgi:uncharacterized membrane protein YfcA